MSAPEEEKKEPVKQLTPAQWAEVVTLWELGETQLEDLSKKYGISISGLSKGLRSRGATKGSRAHEVAAKVKEAAIAARVEDTVSAEQERQAKIGETRKQHYDWAKAISAQTMNLIAKAVQAGRPVESEMGNIKALRQAMATLAIGRSERFAVLNADDDMGEGELPVLGIEDLSDAEIEEMQRADDNDDAILAEENPVVELV